MKEVNLARPAFVKDLLRYPVENPLTVTDEEAQRLKDAGLLEPDSDGDLEGMKVAQLRQIASDEDINLGNAQSKPDIITAIRAHREGGAEKEA